MWKRDRLERAVLYPAPHRCVIHAQAARNFTHGQQFFQVLSHFFNSSAVREVTPPGARFNSSITTGHVSPFHQQDPEPESCTVDSQPCLTACYLPILYISVPN